MTLLILLLVFGSLVAAGLPVLTGIYTVIAAVSIVTGLTYIFDDITTYANNIVSLLGIGLSVDYSLFIVNRFREELRKGRDHRTAIAMTSATAGGYLLLCYDRDGWPNGNVVFRKYWFAITGLGIRLLLL